MENEYQPLITALRVHNFRYYHSLSSMRKFVKKLIIFFIAIFFPWLLLYKLTMILKKIKEETLNLAQIKSISLFLDNKVFRMFKTEKYGEHLLINDIAGMLHWPELLDEQEREYGFGELLNLLNLSYTKTTMADKPSQCWVLLAAKNCDQLLKYGYDNFKRTIGHNYFNFLVQEGDPQIKTVEQALPVAMVESCRRAALAMPRDPNFQARDQFSYYYFVLLLWEYVKQIDVHSYLDKLEEPKEGNPILVHAQGKSMSQDLANSLIEYYSIDRVVSFQNIKTILEIGDGYGRNAHVILTLNPGIRVILVDILPALYIAQRYLSSVFKDRTIFKARNFKTYQKIKEEIESASIIFLLPHQLSLLPDHYVNLSMNISSFGEMSVDQIDWYFEQINRLTYGYFYTKQWNESKNPFDGLVLHKADYPDRAHWIKLYSRNCVIQNDFFETLFEVKIQ